MCTWWLFQMSLIGSGTKPSAWLGKGGRALGTTAPELSSLLCQPPRPGPGSSSYSACPQTQEERALSEPMTVPHAEDLEGTVFKGFPLASAASWGTCGLTAEEAGATVPLQGGRVPPGWARCPAPRGAS